MKCCCWESFVRKVNLLFCDNENLNRRILCWRKSFREVEKILCRKRK
jgi:hypothetical protein